MRLAAAAVLLVLASSPIANAQIRAQGTTATRPPAHGFRSTLSGPRVQPARPSMPPMPRARSTRPLTFFPVWWHWGPVILETPAFTPRLSAGGPPGGVQLDVVPWSAQVFVDGAPAGRVEEFRGYYHHLELSAGPHVLSIVQAGYDPLIFEVMVVPGKTISYRATLTR